MKIRGYLVVIAVLLLTGCGIIPAPQEVTAETIDTVDQTSTVVTNMGMDFKTLLMFAILAGWAIPSPSEMLGWIVKILLPFKWW